MEKNIGRQQWSDEAIKCMLDTCLEEMQRLGKNRQSLHRESWAKLGNKLKENFGMNLTQKQMRNAFDNIKQKYVGWCYLRNKTGNLYNPQTNMFSLTNQEWKDFKKGHPKAMSLRTRPMPYVDLCIALFGGLSGNGGNQWTSSQSSRVSSSYFNQQGQTLQIENASFHNLEDDDDGDSHEQGSKTGDGIRANNEGPSACTTPKVDEVRPKKKAKTSETATTLDDLASVMHDALKHIKSMKGPSIDECYEKLKLVGLEPTDPLFLAAFSMFGQSKQMREAWMALPADPEVLKGFIKMMGTASGIFK